MPNCPQPPRAARPPDKPEDASARRYRLSADVRPLTKAELESMRREFKASSEWMDRELAANPLDSAVDTPPQKAET